ncbi:MAG: RDD family protein [Elusimicrobia bacterium]|nr:RDD family protein [Elusimicrobiota bacterium]
MENPGAGTAVEGLSEPEPAGFWIRAGALGLDWLIALTVLWAPILLGLTSSLRLSREGYEVCGALGLIVYFTLSHWLGSGRTPGKLAAGIAVVSLDGTPIGPGRSLARALLQWVSLALLGLGFLSAAVTPFKRALHDFAEGTRVVYVGSPPLWRRALVTAAGLLIISGALFAIYEMAQALAGIHAEIPRHMRAAIDGAAAKGLDLPANSDQFMARYDYLTPAETDDHPAAPGVEVYGAQVCSGRREAGQALLGNRLRDTGRWGYVYAPESPCHGWFFLDCTHAGVGGKKWFEH